jgi:hypothetical protein
MSEYQRKEIEKQKERKIKSKWWRGRALEGMRPLYVRRWRRK